MVLRAMSLLPPIRVFDFFSGCGGASRGFRDAGMNIVAAIDNDPDASRTYKRNFPGVTFIQDNIETISVDRLQSYWETNREHPTLFAGCAPCQPFTRQNTSREASQSQRHLLSEFRRFVEHFQPEYVFVENVPGLQNVTEAEGPFTDLLKVLEKHHYKRDFHIVAAQRYGVPQMRRRLILVASRLGPIVFPPFTHGPGMRMSEYSTVREWIAHYPPIDAGQSHSTIPNHRAANLSPLNHKRIQATPEGGGRDNWPAELRLACHTNGYEGHSDVYGRMKWDAPASGLTTRCVSLSNGRFGHPVQNRAISIREAASLQTFPDDFEFFGSLASMSRQIGNAVPVLLARRFGENFVRHFAEYLERTG